MNTTKNIFVVYAVEEEFIPLISTNSAITYICTGVGKTKSAMHLTKHICRHKPDFVLNIGTAGTFSHQVGDIFVATHFVDRDYRNAKLPGIEYKINGMDLIQNPSLKNWIQQYAKQGICSTGDTFVTEVTSSFGDLVDMEAYALASVCKEFDIPFLAIKYITDIIGQNSVSQWEHKLSDARRGLIAWFDTHQIMSIID